MPLYEYECTAGHRTEMLTLYWETTEAKATRADPPIQAGGYERVQIGERKLWVPVGDVVEDTRQECRSGCFCSRHA